MKNFILVLIFLPIIASSQIFDNFSDGNFNSNPEWKGDTDSFIIDDDLELRLNNDEAGISSLYTSSYLSLNVRWEFRIKMEFNPSSSNYCRFYLSSENKNFDTAKSYYINIGKTNDKLEIFYFDGSSKELILSSNEDYLNNSNVELDILIEKKGNDWSLKTKEITHEDYILISENKITFQYFQSNLFAIEPHYTITRSNKFSFDNFDISEIIIPDNEAPIVNEIKILDENETMISFDEKVLPFTEINIGVIPEMEINDITTTDSINYTISFKSFFENGKEYNFSINNISDLSSNTLVNFNEDILFYIPSENDIVINEIMFDPNPRVNLPELEYIEFYNNSGGIVEMKNWILEISNREYNIPNIRLEKDGYLLVLPQEIDGYSSILNKIIIDFSALNNTSSILKIKTDSDLLIDQIEYSSEWFKNGTKNEGGWSLELINPQNNCLKNENWAESVNENGGSPGKENSIIDLNYYPEIENQLTNFYTDDILSKITLLYSNYTDEQSISITTNYSSPFEYYLQNTANGTSKIELNLENSISSLTYFYFENLKSCDGSFIENDTIWIDNFRDIKEGDIVINEIMFEPKDESSEFVEIFNNSDKFFNLRGFYLCNYTNIEEISTSENQKKLSENNIVFPPRSYFVITKNSESIRNNYLSAESLSFIEISTLPKMSNDNGNIALLDQSMNFVDKISYSENMHINLMKEEKRQGISLERIKATNPSLDWNNWTSASQNSGGATPGLNNSATPKDYIINDAFEVVPEVFTPNSDGINDIAEVIYKMNKSGYIANIKVFDANGIFIKDIANNYLMGIEGSFIWDGTNTNNRIKQKGIYVFWIEIFDLDGNVKVYKRIVVLG